MSTNTAKRPKFLEEMMSTAPRHEPEVEEAEKSLKETRLAIPTPMLDIVLRNGTIRCFNYAYLAEVEFEPGDRLVIRFSTGAEILVEGRGLARHRQQVRLHRADEIRECPEVELLSEKEGISQVEKISITEAEEE